MCHDISLLDQLDSDQALIVNFLDITERKGKCETRSSQSGASGYLCRGTSGGLARGVGGIAARNLWRKFWYTARLGWNFKILK